jgi:hypothetical protein
MESTPTRRIEAFRTEHEFEDYEGEHVNRIGERLRTHGLAFYTENLDF